LAAARLHGDHGTTRDGADGEQAGAPGFEERVFGVDAEEDGAVDLGIPERCGWQALRVIAADFDAHTRYARVLVAARASIA
jgi:hypothetical protein